MSTSTSTAVKQATMAAAAAAPAANFIKQTLRKDVLTNLLLNKHLPAPFLFDLVMNENGSNPSASRKGFIFETLSTILTIAKCIDGLNYTSICAGQLQTLRDITDILELLDIKINQGDNPSDITLKQVNATLVAVSVKYREKYTDTQVSILYQTIKEQQLAELAKVALIVKDKSVYTTHKYTNNQSQKKLDLDKVIANNLLFDETDILRALSIFCHKYAVSTTTDTKKFIHHINEKCLLSQRKSLVQKLHQRMTLLKFMTEFKKNHHKMWCIAHKPRSGKSITLLSICQFLLANNYKKILIMTSVPATIKSFIDDLNKYDEFNDILYKNQEEFMTLDNKTFNGIVFCSVQYLKSDGKHKKKEQLKKLGFDAIITDESHQGSSTDKTKSEIFDADLDEIRENILLKIFASGTATKTKKYYGISSSCVYSWEMEDEAYMKQIIKNLNRDEIVKIMSARHGPFFEQCLADITLNQDYTKHPVQVLMKHNIDRLLIQEIDKYNKANGTSYGYNCASLFALKQEAINEKGETVYSEKFALEESEDGTNILKSFFEHIISNNQMKTNTIMKHIEATQHRYDSRKSTAENPLMFNVYLPTHTGNGNINMLQKTIKKFLETNKLWHNYNIEYSNAIDNSNVVNEKEYNNEIAAYMSTTRLKNKRGCILLLGSKGTVGITYNDCDVTISLDEGHNLDNQRQRFSRALTEAPGKTVGINVDMNIQRAYTYMMDTVQKHRNITKTVMTNAEIMYYLFKNNIFLFDPQCFNNGLVKECEILSYYEKESSEMLKQIDDTAVLDNIVCDDEMHDLILASFKQDNTTRRVINTDLEGDQQDCSKGDKTKTLVDGPSTPKEKNPEVVEDETAEKVIVLKNETLEMCKSFMFPLLGLISRSCGIPDFKALFINDKTRDLIRSLLIDKKIDLSENNYNIIITIMNTIMDNNTEIVNSIREIYSSAPSHKLRDLIAKHFIPTAEEKKKHAEVPTPVKLVNEMLHAIPADFWKMPRKVFEPCCGKGHFVMAIFDNFNIGLQDMYPDNEERCRVIMKDCIYYTDITALNVFITTEIMKCHIQSYCGIEDLDYEFNSHIGNTLDLVIRTKWALDGFDAVIGNPPYNDNSGNKGKGHTLWTHFIEKSLNEFVLTNGYLVFVHPSVWRQVEHPCLNLLKDKQIIYLEIHNVDDGQKTFRCATRYDWYVLQNTPCYKNTIIKDEEGKINDINLQEWDFIPNMMFTEIKQLISSDNKLDVWRYRSMYGTENKKLVSTNKTDAFKYPLVYTINKQNEITFRYTNDNSKGHFGTAKFIFSNGAGFHCDEKGELGLTEWAYCVYDSKENLSLIEKAFRSDKFNKIKMAIQLDSSSYNIKVMKLFSKTFWQEFS